MNDTDYDHRRRDIFFALRTRRLTDEELIEARDYGSRLNIEPRVEYYPAEKARELADAWTVQGMMRVQAPQAGAGYVGGANNSLFEIRELGT